MINYKFRVIMDSKLISDLEMIVPLRNFMSYMYLVEREAISPENIAAVGLEMAVKGYTMVLLTSYMIHETTMDDIKASFKLACKNSRPSISVFQSGKYRL